MSFFGEFFQSEFLVWFGGVEDVSPCPNPPCCGGCSEEYYLIELGYDWIFTGMAHPVPKYQLGKKCYSTGIGQGVGPCVKWAGPPGGIHGEGGPGWRKTPFAYYTILHEGNYYFVMTYGNDGAFVDFPPNFTSLGNLKYYAVVYDLGTSEPSESFADLDLSGTPVVYYAPGVEGTMPIVNSITFTEITREEYNDAYECKSVCEYFYLNWYDYLFDYDLTSVDPPPYSCCLLWQETKTGEETVAGVSVPTSYPDESYPFSPAIGWSTGPLFFLRDGEIIAAMAVGVGEQSLGTPWLSDLPFPIDFDIGDGWTLSYTGWGDPDDCYNTLTTDCYGALLPDYIRLETSVVCEPGVFPAVVCLERIGETCNYTTGELTYNGETFEVTASVDGDRILTFASDTFFGNRYSFTTQLSATNYLSTTQTINNAMSAGNPDDRYVKYITITWTAATDCGMDALDEDDCPLCADDSQDTKCIFGVPELTSLGDGPPAFYFNRVSSCYWTAADVYWCGDDAEPYSAYLEGTIDGCLVTFKVRITHDGEWVEYSRTYNVYNASTNCTGFYLFQESARSDTGVLPELGDTFHLEGGRSEECEPFDWETEYCIPTKLRVLYGIDDIQMDLDFTNQVGDILTYGPNANDCETPGESITITVLVEVIDRYCLHISMSSVVYPPSTCAEVSGEEYPGIEFFSGGTITIDGCYLSFEPFECP